MTITREVCKKTTDTSARCQVRGGEMKCGDCQWLYDTRNGEIVCAEPPVGLDDEPCGEFSPRVERGRDEDTR
jgi:hypothetical protein